MQDKATVNTGSIEPRGLWLLDLSTHHDCWALWKATCLAVLSTIMNDLNDTTSWLDQLCRLSDCDPIQSSLRNASLHCHDVNTDPW